MRIKLSTAVHKAVSEFPETGMGYHYLYMYLKGPFPEQQVFRIPAVILNSTYFEWPEALGEPEEYTFVRFAPITPQNSHIKND